MWSLTLLTVVCLSMIGAIWFRTGKIGNPYLGSLVTGVFLLFVISQWIYLDRTPGDETIASALHMGALSFVLVWITTVIWHLKPIYARYPFAFTLSPILLVLGFPWISWVPSLMHLFFMVIELGILMILLLLWFSIRKKLPSSILFLSTWCIGLILWSGQLFQFEVQLQWISHVIASILVVMSSLLYEQFVQELEEFQRR